MIRVLCRFTGRCVPASAWCSSRMLRMRHANAVCALPLEVFRPGGHACALIVVHPPSSAPGAIQRGANHHGHHINRSMPEWMVAAARFRAARGRTARRAAASPTKTLPSWRCNNRFARPAQCKRPSPWRLRDGTGVGSWGGGGGQEAVTQQERVRDGERGSRRLAARRKSRRGLACRGPASAT